RATLAGAPPHHGNPAARCPRPDRGAGPRRGGGPPRGPPGGPPIGAGAAAREGAGAASRVPRSARVGSAIDRGGGPPLPGPLRRAVLDRAREAAVRGRVTAAMVSSESRPGLRPTRAFARRFLAAWILALLGLAAACDRDSAAAWHGMNVIWISFDSVRADHCSFEGYARKTTPQLDALAARGVRFPKTIAQAPYTLPSYASMLASRYVAELAVREQRDEKDTAKVLSIAPGPSPSDALVAEAFHDGGYRTAAFVQSWVSAPFGFDQGWDLFRHAQESLREKMPHVLDWIEQNRERPFFAFVYSTDTHYPFLHAHERHDLYG